MILKNTVRYTVIFYSASLLAALASTFLIELVFRFATDRLPANVFTMLINIIGWLVFTVMTFFYFEISGNEASTRYRYSWLYFTAAMAVSGLLFATPMLLVGSLNDGILSYIYQPFMLLNRFGVAPSASGLICFGVNVVVLFLAYGLGNRVYLNEYPEAYKYTKKKMVK